MGGHAAGEVASAAAIGSLRPHDEDVGQGALLEALGHAVTEANGEVARRADEDPARRGMATTLTAMLWSGDHFALAHIGDSRVRRRCHHTDAGSAVRQPESCITRCKSVAFGTCQG